MAEGATPAHWTPYCGSAPLPGELLSRWNLDPLLLLALAAFVMVWWVRAGYAHPESRVPFAAAMAVLVVLFVSPLCALTSALFAARSAHHALLVACAAPLLAWALPRRGRGRLGLAAGTGLNALVLWAWHIPAFYEAALAHDWVYWGMQASLLAASLAFWRAVRTAAMPGAIAALLATMIQMGLLGALLTFASAPLYAPHFLTTTAWGLSPLDDQQLAGLIMWAPAAAFYLFAAILIAGRWLNEEQRTAA